VIDLDNVVLSYGAHDSPDGGTCIMEVVSMIAGEPFSDHPECASPTLGRFLRDWNDALDDDERQNLLQYAPRLVNSRGSDEIEEKRAWMAADWLVRVNTPAWLRAAGLSEHADALAQAAPLDGGVPAATRERLDAAGDAAWAAAGSAVWAAAGWVAAENAARAAGLDAAQAAAQWAGLDVIWITARDVALNAAGDVALHVAGDVALHAIWDAARAALAPTVKMLQESAHDLVDRMLAATGN
jgi:hypothetical protein